MHLRPELATPRNSARIRIYLPLLPRPWYVGAVAGSWPGRSKLYARATTHIFGLPGDYAVRHRGNTIDGHGDSARGRPGRRRAVRAVIGTNTPRDARACAAG